MSRSLEQRLLDAKLQLRGFLALETPEIDGNRLLDKIQGLKARIAEVRSEAKAGARRVLGAGHIR